MKKIICVMLALLCMLSALCGCRSREAQIENGVKIYYVRKDEGGKKSIEYEERAITSTDPTERARDIFTAVKTPESEDAYMGVPEYIYIRSIKIDGDVLYIDFSNSFSVLSSSGVLIASTLVSMSMLDAGIAKYIKITCEGKDQPPFYDEYIHYGNLFAVERMYME